MFVLNQKIRVGYSFKQRTFYSTSHKGQDYRANYWNLYAPFDCKVTTFYDTGGGKWVNLTSGNTVIQCAHLSKYIKTGLVKEGEVVAVTGNTGKYTSGPHLHLQIKVNGILVDPEKYNWEGLTMSQYNDIIKQFQANDRRFSALSKRVDDNFRALQKEYKKLDTTQQQEIVKLTEAINNLSISCGGQSVISAEDKESISWLTKVLKAIFNK